MRCYKSLVLASLVALTLGQAASGQSRLFSRSGQSLMEYYGKTVRRAGDVNGDGVQDVLVGAHGESSNAFHNGMIQALSGQDGSVLYSVFGSDSFDQLGLHVAGGGDVNGDGFDDMIASVHLHTTGETSVFSGQDGSVLYTLAPPAAGSPLFFGRGLSLGGDLNGDGLSDVLVSGFGLVEVYSGIDGSLVHHIPPPGPNASGFGYAATFIGDVDSDGLDDFAVSGGAVTGQPIASIYVFSGVDKSILYRVDSTTLMDGFGTSIAAAGDVDADGIPDFIVGADQVSLGRSGYASVFSGVDGRRLFRLEGKAVGDDFSRVAGVGDVNADGFDDVAVGAPGADQAPGLYGEVRVVSGKDGLPLTTFRAATPQQLGMGGSLDGVGDVNGDGHADLAIGSSFANSPGGVSDVGTVEVFSGACLALRRYCTGGLNSIGKRARMLTDGTTSLADASFSVSAFDMPPGRPGLFQVGDAQLQAPFGDGFRCVGGSVFRVGPFVHADARGVAAADVDLSAAVFTPGATWNFQLWYRDTGPAGFNLSDAMEATFCP